MILSNLGTVTPHVGVWIETPVDQFMFEEREVTPHVGVWIETLRTRRCRETITSHLM